MDTHDFTCLQNKISYVTGSYALYTGTARTLTESLGYFRVRVPCLSCSVEWYIHKIPKMSDNFFVLFTMIENYC